jgi:WD40 repeat protein
VHGAVFSPDGTRIIAACDDGATRIWEARTGQLLQVLVAGAGQNVNSARFSPNGKQAVTTTVGSTGSATQIWQLSTQRPRITQTLTQESALARVQPGASEPLVLFASFSPDARWIATANSDATASVWAAETGLKIADLGAHTASVNTVEFSSNGRKLVTASDDGNSVIHTSDVCGSVDNLLRLASRRIHSSLTVAEKTAYLSQP